MSAPASLPEELACLRACLATVTDPRHARGIRHPLLAVLSLTVLALMAGNRSRSAIVRWGALHPELLAALDLRCSPSVPTLSRLLRAVSVDQVRAALLTFTRGLQAPRGAGAPDPSRASPTAEVPEVVAADGKTMRGAWAGGRQLHVLHLFATHSRVALDQVPVTDRRDEVTATHVWIEQIADQFPGLSVLTGDAMLADRTLCQAIVDSGRDYLFRVKKTNRISTKPARSSSPTRRAGPTSRVRSCRWRRDTGGSSGGRSAPTGS
jgi:DDE family transposase